MFHAIQQTTPIQHITCLNGVSIDIKRIDLVHPYISGNKFYKLKYNFEEAIQLGYTSVLTFGGAYSNHILATAYAAQHYGLNSIGIIRGDELKNKPYNQTLTRSAEYGMQLEFISRSDYQQKDQVHYLNTLQKTYPQAYIIPEGGTNLLAIQGCKEILSDADFKHYDVICVAVGTGGTITGLIEASSEPQHILGFSALHGDFLTKDVQALTSKRHWSITDAYCFGGYAKKPPLLMNFINEFEKNYQIPLEPIYTGKMMYGVFDLIYHQQFTPKTKILVIHTGGLQGK